jgi:hypothetical protein
MTTCRRRCRRLRRRRPPPPPLLLLLRRQQYSVIPHHRFLCFVNLKICNKHASDSSILLANSLSFSSHRHI